MEERGYQTRAVESVLSAWSAKQRRVLLVMPTASGKTATASRLVEKETQRGSGVLWIVDRRELIRQASERMTLNGIRHGVIQAGKPPTGFALVQIASIATLDSRDMAPPANLIVWDECHIKTGLKIAELYPDARHLGLTATPVEMKRGQPVPIKGWDATVEAVKQSELLVDGWITPFKIVAPHIPDLKSVKRIAGDYKSESIAAIMSENAVVKGAVDSWNRFTKGLKTVVFCCTIAHAEKVKTGFGEQGIRAVVVVGATKGRDELLAEFVRGAFDVVISVGVLSVGWDCPSLRCVLMLRPTASLSVYLQQCGRGVRKDLGKEFCWLIDHTGNVIRHLHPQMDRIWDPESEAAKKAQRSNESMWRCEECFAMLMGRPGGECPICGAKVATQSARIREVDGKVEIYDEDTFRALEEDNAARLAAEAEQRAVNNKVIRYLIARGKGAGMSDGKARSRAFGFLSRWRSSDMEWEQFRVENRL